MNSQPFVDEESFLYSLFPAREWAIRIPVILLLVFLAIVGSFIGVVLVRSEKSKWKTSDTAAEQSSVSRYHDEADTIG